MEDNRDDAIEVFYKNPMVNLKHFEIGHAPALYRPEFLMKMKKTFPNLETLIIDAYDAHDPQPQGGCCPNFLLLGKGPIFRFFLKNVIITDIYL